MSGTTLVDEKLGIYRDLSSKMQTLYVQKQQSLSQFNENTLVKGELDIMSDDAKVYKLVGPVLMKVDLEEAKQNVSKRLEFIEAEIKKVDNQIDAVSKQQNEVGDEIVKMQQEMQKKAAEETKKIMSEVTEK